MSDQQETSFVVARLLEDYLKIWDKYFPECIRRAHWHALNMARPYDDGILFSTYRGRMDDTLGMDNDTCAERLRELEAQGLLEIDSEKFSSSTCLIPTEKMKSIYDHHVVEALREFFRAAGDIRKSPIRMPHLNVGKESNKLLADFFTEFGDVWSEHVYSFLKTGVSSPALRLKALRRIRTFAYWHILITSWKNRNPLCNAKKNYLFVDDFHREIYSKLGVGHKATTGYVQDMLNWNVLERLGREDGVPKNKFAVRMSDKAYEHFSRSLEDIARIIFQLVDSAARLSHSSSSVGQTDSGSSLVILPQKLA